MSSAASSELEGEYDPYAPVQWTESAGGGQAPQPQSVPPAPQSQDLPSEQQQRHAREQAPPTRAAGTAAAASASRRAPPTTSLPAQASIDVPEEPAFGGRPFAEAHRLRNARDLPAEASPGDHEEEQDLYSILNVSTDASSEAIREAWRSVAVMLHPDKQPTPALKTRAEAQFRAAQRAYEVLSDPETRAVYDALGHRGLTHSWALTTTRGANPQDLMRELEQASMRKAAEDAEALVKNKSDVEVRIDASTLFCDGARVPRIDPQAPVTLADRFNRVGTTQLSARHGFDVPITQHTSANVAAQMVSRGRVGGGNLVGTIKTQWRPQLWTELTATAIRPHMGSLKAQWDVNQHTFFSLAASQQTLAAPPVVALTYGQRLSPSAPLMGFTTFKTGHYTLGVWGSGVPLIAREPPSISVGMTSQDGADSGWTVQTSLALQNQGLSLNWARRVALLGGARISTGLNFGTASGVEAFFNTERRITETFRVTVGVSTGLPRGGVTLNIKANRLGQKVSVPILMAPEYRSDVVGACVVLPVLGFVALEHLYLRPVKRARITDRLRTLREKNREVIVERRVAAHEAQEVMFANTRTKARRAWQQGGLVVLEAWYGRRQHFPQAAGGDPQALFERVWEHAAAEQPPASAPDGDVWDVRVPLQALISKGQLLVPGGRAKSSLLGFYDPCMGERKHLCIRYAFRGRLHEAVVSDTDQLAAPLRDHQR